jgi:hypothetical protein
MGSRARGKLAVSDGGYMASVARMERSEIRNYGASALNCFAPGKAATVACRDGGLRLRLTRQLAGLTPDKFDHCFIAFDRGDNCRQGAQHELDQLSIARIANSDPQDRWAIVRCGPAKGKVAILGDENRRAGNGFIPNLLVASSLQPEIDNVNRLTADLAQRLCQQGRKLRIYQKEQNLFRRDDGMVRLTGSKGQNRIDVRVFEIRILLKNRLSRLAG